MITQQLLDYIQDQKRSGASNESIIQSLLANGWDPADVDTALGSLTDQGATARAAAVPPVTLSQAEAVAAVRQMGRFKASWRLFKQSLNILRQDKEIMLYPIATTIAILVLTILFGFAIATLSPQLLADDATTSVINDVLLYSIVFVYYVIAFFIATFFRVALTAIVYERINGGNLSFSQGLGRATAISGKIFLWSLITSTVGIVLKIISDRSKWLGKLVASLLGSAWNIVTMFIAPTLLLDKVSVWKSIGRSAEVFKKTWGETLILNISFGIVTLLLLLLDFIVFFLLGMAVVTAGLGVAGVSVVGILFFLSLVLIVVISNSLNEIFKVVLYSYARFGIIAEGFSPELIVGAVKTDEKTTQA
jgi:NADH:ubiquinone oxidoreductase subunit 3 (subunit A)/uncharacterized Tic20 family protein